METNETTLKVMEWLSDAANKIGDFAREEIPPFIHEFLTWRFAETAIDAAWSMIYVVLALIILIFYSKRVMRWGMKYADESGGLSVAAVTVLLFIAVIIIFAKFPLDEVKTMVKIKAAPKVYLIEEAANVIKSIREEKK